MANTAIIAVQLCVVELLYARICLHNEGDAEKEPASVPPSLPNLLWWGRDRLGHPDTKLLPFGCNLVLLPLQCRS